MYKNASLRPSLVEVNNIYLNLQTEDVQHFIIKLLAKMRLLDILHIWFPIGSIVVKQSIFYINNVTTVLIKINILKIYIMLCHSCGELIFNNSSDV